MPQSAPTCRCPIISSALTYSVLIVVRSRHIQPGGWQAITAELHICNCFSAIFEKMPFRKTTLWPDWRTHSATVALLYARWRFDDLRAMSHTFIFLACLIVLTIGAVISFAAHAAAF